MLLSQRRGGGVVAFLGSLPNPPLAGQERVTNPNPRGVGEAL